MKLQQVIKLRVRFKIFFITIITIWWIVTTITVTVIKYWSFIVIIVTVIAVIIVVIISTFITWTFISIIIVITGIIIIEEGSYLPLGKA